jgi:hypothetical protein
MTDVAFAPTPTVEHRATAPEDEGTKFYGKCLCGWKSSAAETPSTAYQRSTDHVARVTQTRDTLAKMNTGTLPSHRADQAPATQKERAPKRVAVQTVCGCGCGESATQRGDIVLVFRPGHDARYLSILANEVKDGTRAKEDALALLAERPKLQAKLASRLG